MAEVAGEVVKADPAGEVLEGERPEPWRRVLPDGFGEGGLRSPVSHRVGAGEFGVGRVEVAEVERLQRMLDGDRRARAPAVHRDGGLVEGLEEFCERGGQRYRLVGCLAAALRHHHQALAGGEQRVPQHLAVVERHRGVTDARLDAQQVVTVTPSRPGVAVGVPAEQHHHPMRNLAQRGQPGNHEGAVAEGAPRGSAGELLLEGPDGSVAGHRSVAGGSAVFGQPGKAHPDVAQLPLLVEGQLDERGEAGAAPVGPFGKGGRTTEFGNEPGQPPDQFGQAADQPDVGGLHVIEGEHRARRDEVGLGKGHTQQHALQPCEPRVLREGLQPVAVPMGLGEAPANPGPLDQVDQALAGLRGESEALRDAGTGTELQQGGGLDTSIGKAQEVEQKGHHRIDLCDRAIGDLHPETLRGMDGRPCRRREGRPHQGGEGVHVGGQDDDVAGFERRVRGQQAREDFPQDLHLPVAAVREMDPDRRVAGLEETPDRRSVGTQVGLQPAQQALRALRLVGRGCRRQQPRGFVGHDGERLVQRMPGQPGHFCAPQVGARHDTEAARDGREQQQVDPVVAIEGAEQVEGCGIQPPRCQDGHALRQPGDGSGAQLLPQRFAAQERVVAQFGGQQPP